MSKDTTIHPSIKTDSIIAAYLRRSQEKDQAGEEETLAHHRQQLESYIARHGLTNVTFYNEIGSGESIADRLVFTALLERVKNVEFDAVLVVAADRISRGSQQEAGYIQDIFQSTGTLLLTPEKVYDYNDENDLLMSEFQSVIARQELRNIKRRLLNGKRSRVTKGGVHNGKVPFGYRWNRLTKEAEIDEEQSAHYLRMVSMYLDEGKSAGVIADEFNALRIPTPRGGLWRSERVTNILTNDFYAGWVVHRRYRSTKTAKRNAKGKLLYLTRLNDNKDETIRKRGNHTPLITEEQYARILERADRLKSRPRGNNPRKTENFRLQGLIYCVHCGKVQSVSKPPDPRQPHVRKCLRKSKTRTPQCDETVGLLEDHLFEIVVEHMKQFKDELFTPTVDDSNSGVNTYLESLERYEFEITKEKTLIEKNKAMYVAEVIDIDELREVTQESRNRIQALEASAASLRERMAVLEESRVERQKKAWSSDDILKLLESPDGMTYGEINSVLRTVIERIEYTIEGDNVHVQIKYY